MPPRRFISPTLDTRICSFSFTTYGRGPGCFKKGSSSPWLATLPQAMTPDPGFASLRDRISSERNLILSQFKGQLGTTRNTASWRKPLVPFGLRAAQAHVLCCPSWTMLEYGLRRVALHLHPRRPHRDPWDFQHGRVGRYELIRLSTKGRSEGPLPYDGTSNPAPGETVCRCDCRKSKALILEAGWSWGNGNHKSDLRLRVLRVLNAAQRSLSKNGTPVIIQSGPRPDRAKAGPGEIGK